MTTTITGDLVHLLRSRGEHESYRGDRLCLDAADEIERLRAYANHERSLGAEGPMIELMQARQEIERLRAALRSQHIAKYADCVAELRRVLQISQDALKTAVRK